MPSAEFYSSAAHALLDGLARAGVGRLVLVGIGSTLETAPGVAVHDAPGFPGEARAFSLGHTAELDVLCAAETDIDWLVIAPPPVMLDDEAPRTGRYRTGDNRVLAGRRRRDLLLLRGPGGGADRRDREPEAPSLADRGGGLTASGTGCRTHPVSGTGCRTHAEHGCPRRRAGAHHVRRSGRTGTRSRASAPVVVPAVRAAIVAPCGIAWCRMAPCGTT